MSKLKVRVGRLEEHATRQWRGETGVLVMKRGKAGLFDERMSRLEADVAALKSNGRRRQLIKILHRYVLPRVRLPL